MKRFIPGFVSILLVAALHAQEGPSIHFDPYKPVYSLGGGATYSTVNSWEESSGAMSWGIRTLAAVQLQRWFCLDLVSNYFFPHDAAPSFRNVHCWSLDVQMNFILPLNSKTKPKFIVLGAYKNWTGTYTGKGLNGSHRYEEGDLLHNHLPEAGIGLGCTRQFGARSYVDLDFGIRVSKHEALYGVSETSVSLTYRYSPFYHPKPKMNEPGSGANEQKNGDAKKKTQHGIAGAKYRWLKKKNR